MRPFPLPLIARTCLALAIAGVALAVFQPTLLAEVERPLATARAAAPAGQTPAVAAPKQAARPTVAPSLTARPSAAPFLMVMSDADLTKAAAGSFPQTVSGVTVSEPDVRIQDGSVRLTASARVLFGKTEFVLLATPSASDGRLAVRVDAATLAGMSLPDSTRASITQTLQSTIARLIPPDARVTSVTLAAGRLSVGGTR